jgi:hypothetical protein
MNKILSFVEAEMAKGEETIELTRVRDFILKETRTFFDELVSWGKLVE